MTTQATQLGPHSLPMAIYGDFAGKRLSPAPQARAYTQLSAMGVPGRRYGNFAARIDLPEVPHMLGWHPIYMAVDGHGNLVAAINRAGAVAVELMWQQPADGGSPIVGYDIQRQSFWHASGFDSAIQGPWTAIGASVHGSPHAAGGLLWHDQLLDNADFHQYRIRAVNALGAGPWSPAYTARAVPPVDWQPITEAPMLAYDLVEDEVALVWSHLDQVLYEIERNGQVIVSGLPLPIYQDEPGYGAIVYRVRAVNPEHVGPWSAPLSVTINAPAQPATAASSSAAVAALHAARECQVKAQTASTAAVTLQAIRQLTAVAVSSNTATGWIGVSPSGAAVSITMATARLDAQRQTAAHAPSRSAAVARLHAQADVFAAAAGQSAAVASLETFVDLAIASAASGSGAWARPSLGNAYLVYARKAANAPDRLIAAVAAGTHQMDVALPNDAQLVHVRAVSACGVIDIEPRRLTRVVFDDQGHVRTAAPNAPIGLRLEPRAGGLIAARWSYAENRQAAEPAHFELAADTGSGLQPVDQVAYRSGRLEFTTLLGPFGHGAEVWVWVHAVSAAGGVSSPATATVWADHEAPEPVEMIRVEVRS